MTRPTTSRRTVARLAAGAALVVATAGLLPSAPANGVRTRYYEDPMGQPPAAPSPCATDVGFGVRGEHSSAVCAAQAASAATDMSAMFP